jgi:hypothetical protein
LILRADLGNDAPRQLRQAAIQLIGRRFRPSGRRLKTRIAVWLNYCREAVARPERFERFGFGVQ